MSECINNYYIYNDSIKESENFDEKILNKGTALYEVIRIIDGKPLFFKKHMARLKNSAKITNVTIKFTDEEIKQSIDKLIDINKVYNGNVKLIFNFEVNLDKLNAFAVYFVRHSYPSKEEYMFGVSTIFYRAERDNPNAKVLNTSFRELVNKEIRDKHAFEAILLDRNGDITEGSKSNIFMVKGDKVITAPLEAVLPGTTRQTIIEICNKLNIQVVEKKINYTQVKDLDALFISGTSPKVLPISKVDKFEFKSPQNEIVLKIMKAYDEEMNRDLA